MSPLSLATALLPGLLAAVVLVQGCAAGLAVGAVGVASAAHDRRTTGTIIDDNVLRFRVRSALHEGEPGLREQSNVSVSSFNNVILLSGETPSETLRRRASEIAAAQDNVRHVHNELVIAAPTSLLSRSNDTVITGRVKTALLARSVDIGNRSKVVTENGVVFLMGLLTREEGDIATDVARRIGGVQRVVKLFEYVD
jgi:osmotically-inducible protein OsmY